MLKFSILVLLSGLILNSAAIASVPDSGTDVSEQPLVMVGSQTVTSKDLNIALASSPVGAQFPTMEEKDQARLRGDILKRLVTRELLYEEALKEGINQTADYKNELDVFRTGLLYQRYLEKMRKLIALPDELNRNLRSKFKGNPDAYNAARAKYVSERFPEMKLKHLEQLAEKYGLHSYPQRLDEQGLEPGTVLAEGDGITIHYGDLTTPSDPDRSETNADLYQERLNQAGEIALMARDAERYGVNVDAQVEAYAHDLMTRLLIVKMENSWVPDEATARAYYEAHPEVSTVPNRWHLGQLVVASRAEAESLHQQIKSGKSLFELAGEYSIDPFGREKMGDMGWVRQGSGMPQLEQALIDLEDGEVSPVVQTPQGFHVLTILERKPGQRKLYSAVHDRIRQAMIAEKMPAYLIDLQQRHPVKWLMNDHR